MIERRAREEFCNITGKERFSTYREDLITYSYDAADISYLPDAVIFPLTEDEIIKIVKTASKYSIPIFPRGAGSGFTGGSVPIKGGLVVCLSKMDKIINIDSENLIVEVEPGVVTEKFQQEAEKRGLFYPPDPASLKFSTIGGNIAECSGGPRAVKYGVTRDYVLGLNLVIPPGKLIKTGVRTAKSVVGYDLTRLITGSEGTLGIITRAILKLIPLPESRICLLAMFRSIEDSAQTVTDIISSKIIPSTIEFMDEESIVTVNKFMKFGIAKECKALLIMEIDGNKEEVEKKAKIIKEICATKNAYEIKMASGKDAIDKLWKIRRSLSPALGQLSPTKINEDITVPRTKIPEILKKIYEIAKRHKLKIICFGHAGDGNIHTNIMTDRNNEEEMERVEKAVEEIFRETVNMGGSISGEHGIGITKSPYISLEIEKEELNLMARIKQAFDPQGIMNPGKIFPPDFNKDGATPNQNRNSYK
ncbi:MAG: FAD-binding protein [Candidatus Schekmanbacteria bacterium]|nr:MAG: FAD-binding protein [Candidatus Schekmanbacteria bacterium]